MFDDGSPEDKKYRASYILLTLFIQVLLRMLCRSDAVTWWR